MRTIQQIMREPDALKTHTLLTARKRPFRTTLEESEEQYNPDKHKIFDTQYRPKKRIMVSTNRKNPLTGETIYKTKLVERVRIAIPFQKVIVKRAVGFLFGNPVTYKMTADNKKIYKPSAQQKTLFDTVQKVFHDNKMKYVDKRLSTMIFRGREAAELWYMETDAKGKPIDMRIKVLSPLNGDKLYPHFNDYDRMDGFAREYKVYDESGTSVRRFDVYDDRFVYRFISDGTGWKPLDVTPKQHGFTKIPVIYYRQEQAEWEDVQWACERAEDCISNWGDTNDYFGTPKYFIKGKLQGFAEKGEQGSVFQGDKDTSMNVLSWDNSPQSVTGELATLISIIFAYTQTPDISFEKMKEISNNTSGAAIRLMFTDPHMKAEDKTEMFGEMFTRRTNLVMNGICNSGVYVPGIPQSVADSMDIEPIFKPYIPKNEVETLQLLNSSTGGKQTTSQRRAIELNPINDNPDEVEEQIKSEQAEAMAQAAAALGAGGSASGEQSIAAEE